MKLSEIKQGVVFMFKDDNQYLPTRGHKTDYPTNGRFIYLWPGDGTCPKVLHMENGTEVYFASEVYSQEVIALTAYITQP